MKKIKSHGFDLILWLYTVAVLASAAYGGCGAFSHVIHTPLENISFRMFQEMCL